MLGFYFFSEFLPISYNFEQKYILGADSERYIKGANEIINFELPAFSSQKYLGYTFYIAIFQYFSLDLSFVVLSQILLTFFSSLCIYKISKKFSSEKGAIFATSLYLFYLPLQMWNFYILTESIFISISIFIVYFFVFFDKKNFLLIFFLIIFYISLRPHGIIIIPSILLSLLIWSYFKNKLKIFYLLVTISITLMIPTIYFLNFYFTNLEIIKNIVNRGIIWSYNDENNYLSYNIETINNNDLLSFLIFIKNNLYTFSVGFLKKIWFFIFRVRPYYSEFHNYYIIFLNLIYLPAAILGIFKMIKKNQLGIFLMISLIILFTLGTGLSWADWDSRFSLYILPFIFIFSGIGINNIKYFKGNFAK